MKCQKCGAQMVSGHLYCDTCGAEYQIVPDFEPELENSIAQSMADISETLEEEERKEKTRESRVRKYKSPSFSLIFVLVLICSFFVYLGCFQYTHSDNYQSRQALQAIDEQDYYKAEKIYEQLRKNNMEDAYWYVKEAEVKLMLEKEEAAYKLAISAIALNENTDIAYEFLFSYLETQEKYEEINQYLKNCSSEKIKETYKEYLCEVPALNYTSGNYDNSLELIFEKGYEGTIYYTLDASIPTKNSSKYESSLKIGNGTHILKAVYENKFGMLGEPVVYEYTIVSEVPIAPNVNVSSGTYKNAEFIEIAVEEGTTVYYTTDLTNPTSESTEYTKPIPMPLGESRFNFIAYSEKGVASEITHRNFMLNMRTNVTLEEAEVLLVQKLISTGHILDKNGAVQNRYGVFRYFYKFPISESERNYYVFEEHYMENQINNPLNQFYGVDVLNGNIYKLISDNYGNYTRIDITVLSEEGIV